MCQVKNRVYDPIITARRKKTAAAVHQHGGRSFRHVLVVSNTRLVRHRPRDPEIARVQPLNVKIAFDLMQVILI